jgi:triacylglycerol lipase
MTLQPDPPSAFSLRPRPRDALLPIWREAGLGWELARLRRSPVYRGEGIARGRGEPVLLTPGFMAGDRSLRVLGSWLHRMGYVTGRSGIQVNAGCPEEAVQELEDRAQALADSSRGGRVALIGHSRGGQLVRALAARRSDLVAGVVTLGSPLSEPLHVHPLVYATAMGVGLLGTVGVKRFARLACVNGTCCAQYRSDLRRELDPGVRMVNVYSRTDGIVDWRACLDPQGAAVEVNSSHVGMAADAGTFRAVARALQAFDYR